MSPVARWLLGVLVTLLVVGSVSGAGSAREARHSSHHHTTAQTLSPATEISSSAAATATGDLGVSSSSSLHHAHIVQALVNALPAQKRIEHVYKEIHAIDKKYVKKGHLFTAVTKLSKLAALLERMNKQLKLTHEFVRLHATHKSILKAELAALQSRVQQLTEQIVLLRRQHSWFSRQMDEYRATADSTANPSQKLQNVYTALTTNVDATEVHTVQHQAKLASHKARLLLKEFLNLLSNLKTKYGASMGVVPAAAAKSQLHKKINNFSASLHHHKDLKDLSANLKQLEAQEHTYNSTARQLIHEAVKMRHVAKKQNETIQVLKGQIKHQERHINHTTKHIHHVSKVIEHLEKYGMLPHNHNVPVLSFSSDGSIFVLHPNATHELQHLSGAVTWKHTDGSSVTRFPNGKSVRKFPNGTEFVHHVNGNVDVVQTHANGTVVIKHANGAVTVSHANHTHAMTTHSNGTLVHTFTNGTTVIHHVNGEVIVKQANGSSIITHPDGTQTKTVVHKNGTFVTKHADGSTTIRQKNGSFVTHHPGGGVTTSTVYTNGTRVTHHQDGSVTVAHSTGHTVHTLANGKVTTSHTHVNGTTVIHHASGAVTVKHANGSSVITHANGTQSTTVVHKNGTTVIKGADGTLTVAHKDGSSVVTHPDGKKTVTTIASNGTATTKHANGDVTVKQPNGSSVTTHANGKQTVVTVHKNGTTVTKHADGSTTVLHLSGYRVHHNVTTKVTTTSFANGTTVHNDEKKGRVVITQSDGSIITHRANGEIKHQFPNHTTIIVHTDGTVTQSQLHANGTLITHHGNGDVSVQEADGTTIIKHKGGGVTMTKVYKDGAKVIRHSSGEVTHSFTNGTAVTVHPDGHRTIAQAYKNGTVVTKHRDGSVITLHPDGSKVVAKPDGRMITVFASGKVATVFTNGTKVTMHTDGSIVTRTSEVGPSRVSLFSNGVCTTDSKSGAGVVKMNGTKCGELRDANNPFNPRVIVKCSHDGSWKADAWVGTSCAGASFASFAGVDPSTCVAVSDALPGFSVQIDCPGARKVSHFAHANGTHVTHFHANGTSVTRHATGEVITKHKDGRTVILKPDGQIERIYKNGTSVITHTNGDQTIREPSGAAITHHSDGSKTVTTIQTDGSALTKHANGDVTVTHKNGTAVTTHANGGGVTVAHTYANKTVVTQHADGSTTVKHASGETIHHDAATGAIHHTHANGTKVVTHKDGTVVISKASGVIITKKPDGSSVVQHVSGDISLHYANGTTIHTTAGGKISVSQTYKNGSTITHHHDGSFEIMHRDGTKVITHPDGSHTVSHTDRHGVTTTRHSNGDISVTHPNGTTITAHGDGRKPTISTVYTNGSVITKHGNGSVTFDHPTHKVVVAVNGTVTTTHRDGTVVVHTPDGATTVHHTNGTAVTKHADGSVTIANEVSGYAVRTHTNGTTVTKHAGSLTIKHANGSSITRHPDGGVSTTVVHKNGTAVTHHANGAVTIKQANGSSVTTHPDGTSTVVTVHQNGTTITKHADGAVTITQPGGSSVTTHADGTQTTTLVYKNGTSIIHHADGAVTVKQANGSSVTTHTDGKQTVVAVNKNGTAVIHHANGDITVRQANGSSVTTHANGKQTVVTVHTNGTTVTKHADGSTTVLHLSGAGTHRNATTGTITHTHTNGTHTIIHKDGTVVTSKPDGQTTIVDKHGLHTTTYPNGTTVVVHPDGGVTHVVSHLNGTVVTTHANGDVSVALANGTTTITHANGKQTVVHAHRNGTSVIHHANGDVSVQHPNGTVVTTHPDGKQSIMTHHKNGTSIVHHANGDVTHVHPNGTSVTTHPDGKTTVSVTHKNGTVVIHHHNGTVTVAHHFTNGTSVMHTGNATIITHSDGTKVTHTANSTVVHHPNGTMVTHDSLHNTTTVTHANGTSVVTHADGKQTTHEPVLIPSDQAAVTVFHNGKCSKLTTVKPFVLDHCATLSDPKLPIQPGVKVECNSDGSWVVRGFMQGDCTGPSFTYIHGVDQYECEHFHQSMPDFSLQVRCPAKLPVVNTSAPHPPKPTPKPKPTAPAANVTVPAHEAAVTLFGDDSCTKNARVMPVNDHCSKLEDARLPFVPDINVVCGTGSSWTAKVWIANPRCQGATLSTITGTSGKSCEAISDSLPGFAIRVACPGHEDHPATGVSHKNATSIPPPPPKHYGPPVPHTPVPAKDVGVVVYGDNNCGTEAWETNANPNLMSFTPGDCSFFNDSRLQTQPLLRFECKADGSWTGQAWMGKECAGHPAAVFQGRGPKVCSSIGRGFPKLSLTAACPNTPEHKKMLLPSTPPPSALSTVSLYKGSGSCDKKDLTGSRPFHSGVCVRIAHHALPVVPGALVTCQSDGSWHGEVYMSPSCGGSPIAMPSGRRSQCVELVSPLIAMITRDRFFVDVDCEPHPKKNVTSPPPPPPPPPPAAPVPSKGPNVVQVFGGDGTCGAEDMTGHESFTSGQCASISHKELPVAPGALITCLADGAWKGSLFLSNECGGSALAQLQGKHAQCVELVSPMLASFSQKKFYVNVNCTQRHSPPPVPPPMNHTVTPNPLPQLNTSMSAVRLFASATGDCQAKDETGAFNFKPSQCVMMNHHALPISPSVHIKCLPGGIWEGAVYMSTTCAGSPLAAVAGKGKQCVEVQSSMLASFTKQKYFVEVSCVGVDHPMPPPPPPKANTTNPVHNITGEFEPSVVKVFGGDGVCASGDQSGNFSFESDSCFKINHKALPVVPMAHISCHEDGSWMGSVFIGSTNCAGKPQIGIKGTGLQCVELVSPMLAMVTKEKFFVTVKCGKKKTKTTPQQPVPVPTPKPANGTIKIEGFADTHCSKHVDSVGVVNGTCTSINAGAMKPGVRVHCHDDGSWTSDVFMSSACAGTAALPLSGSSGVCKSVMGQGSVRVTCPTVAGNVTAKPTPPPPVLLNPSTLRLWEKDAVCTAGKESGMVQFNSGKCAKIVDKRLPVTPGVIATCSADGSWTAKVYMAETCAGMMLATASGSGKQCIAVKSAMLAMAGAELFLSIECAPAAVPTSNCTSVVSMMHTQMTNANSCLRKAKLMKSADLTFGESGLLIETLHGPLTVSTHKDAACGAAGAVTSRMLNEECIKSGPQFLSVTCERRAKSSKWFVSAYSSKTCSGAVQATTEGTGAQCAQLKTMTSSQFVSVDCSVTPFVMPNTTTTPAVPTPVPTAPVAAGVSNAKIYSDSSCSGAVGASSDFTSGMCTKISDPQLSMEPGARITCHADGTWKTDVFMSSACAGATLVELSGKGPQCVQIVSPLLAIVSKHNFFLSVHCASTPAPALVETASQALVPRYEDCPVQRVSFKLNMEFPLSPASFSSELTAEVSSCLGVPPTRLQLGSIKRGSIVASLDVLPATIVETTPPKGPETQTPTTDPVSPPPTTTPSGPALALCLLEADRVMIQPLMPALRALQPEAARLLDAAPTCLSSQHTCIPSSLKDQVTPAILTMIPKELRHIVSYPSCPQGMGGVDGARIDVFMDDKCTTQVSNATVPVSSCSKIEDPQLTSLGLKVSGIIRCSSQNSESDWNGSIFLKQQCLGTPIPIKGSGTQCTSVSVFGFRLGVRITCGIKANANDFVGGDVSGNTNANKDELLVIPIMDR